MLLTQIVDNSNPLAYWTGENFGSENVFDYYSNHTLVNDNAILNQPGNTNPSFSGKSFNLQGGNLKVQDLTFCNNNLLDRNLLIGFSLRIPNRDKNNPISGFKPLVGKWNPEQSFAIYFENGIIKSSIMTINGIETLEFDYPDIIYNNRFNYIQLEIHSTGIRFYVNGCVISSSNNSVITTSTVSPFQIGGSNSEIFTEDVLINDISVTESFGVIHCNLFYVAPSNLNDRILNLNPKYYYNLIESKPTEAYKNKGSVGGYGYIVSDTEPTIQSPETGISDKSVHFPPGSKFVVDTVDQNIKITDGITIAFNAKIGFSGLTNTTVPPHELLLFEIRDNLTSNDNRLFYSYNYTSNSTFRRYLASNALDGSGVSVDTLLLQNSLNDWTNHGLKSIRHESNTTTVQNQFFYNFKQSTPIEGEFSYELNGTPTILNFLNNKKSTNCYASQIMLFDYNMPIDAIDNINPPVTLMIAETLKLKHNPHWIAFYHSNTNDILKSYSKSSVTSPIINTGSWSVQNNIDDPNFNRYQQLNSSLFLANTTARIGGATSDDNIIFTNGMTQYFYIWNQNDSTRYRFIQNSSGLDFEVWMNSRDGEFSYGDIEVLYDKDDLNTSLSSTSKILQNNGFHFVGFTYENKKMRLWINGTLDNEKLINNSVTLDNTNTTLQMFGGPIYMNNWGVYPVAFTSEEMSFAFQGFRDFVQGKTLLNNQPLPSILLSTDYDSGEVLQTHTTDSSGNFDFLLPSSDASRAITILALPQDENTTNNVVAHGPYNLQTDYRKYEYDNTIQDYNDMVIDMEPYAYYRLNEVSGNIASDSSGNGRDGDIIGGVVLDLDGPNNELKSFEFNGVDGYIDLPDGYDFNINDGITFEFWVNSDYLGTFPRLMSVGTSLTENANRIQTGINSTNSYISISNSSSVTINSGSFINKPSNSEWSHVVFTVKDQNSQLWINGFKYADEITLTESIPQILRTENFIAKSIRSSDSYFGGKLSNVSIYDCKLPEEEIIKHSSRGFTLLNKTMKSVIENSSPKYYFTFDRLKQFQNETNENATLLLNGSVDIKRNSLVINNGVPGNNYLSSSDISIRDSVDGWSVELSIKIGQTIPNGILVGQWNTAGDVGTFKLQTNNSNLLSLHINDELSQISSTTLYSDDIWHHIFIVHENNSTRLYIDGSLENSINGSINYSTFDFSIGNSSDGHTTTFLNSETHIDDLAIYEYALNTSKVEEHFNQFLKKKRV